MNKNGMMERITDPRITADMERIRNGRRQEFRHEDGSLVVLEAPRQSWYAELVYGQWWWVDGCSVCNGRPRVGLGYLSDCEEHDTCVDCGANRNSLDESVWANSDGWQCSPCHDREKAAVKAAALAAMPEEHDPSDYHALQDITCPYCNKEWSDSWEWADAHEQELECERCDNTFIVTAEVEITYRCERMKN